MGGTLPYSYAWSDGPATSQDRSNLGPGSYTVTVTDAHGCSDQKTVLITQPNLLVVSEQHLNVLCNGGSNGSIDISVVGGTMPYSFAWSDGPAITEDRSGLTAGSYTVTVTDANLCTASYNFV